MSKQTVQQYLGVPKSWLVRENVKHSIVLTPTKADIKGAVQLDPQACALHNAACRMFNIPNCAIGGRKAYIPQKDEKGNMYIARMEASVATREAIRVFDKTGKIPEGGFVFNPVAPSQRYLKVAAYHRKYEKGLVGNAANPRTYKRRKKLLKVQRTVPHALRAA